jgi:hypothetical protein
MQILVAPLLEMDGDAFPQWRPTGAEMNGEDAHAPKTFLFQFIEFFRDHFRRLKKYSAFLAIRKELLACGPHQDRLFRNVLFRR